MCAFNDTSEPKGAPRFTLLSTNFYGVLGDGGKRIYPHQIPKIPLTQQLYRIYAVVVQQ